MAAKKKSVGSTSSKAVVHLGSQFSVQFGILDGPNVTPLEPLNFNLSRFDAESLSELLGMVVAKREEALASVNAPAPPPETPAAD